MLIIKQLHAYYGPIEALKGVDVSINENSIVALIGSNGAGKTTLLNSISAMIEHKGGIELNGESIAKMNSIQIARKGVIHVPEGRHVFPGLTVLENLEVACVNWRGFFGRSNHEKELQYVYEMFPKLKERSNQLAWSLSGGEQQMLAIGRALMARPKILLLDEPSMGLAPIIIEELFEKIVEINQNGTTILMVEQNARLALEISDKAYIINQGKIELSGQSKDLMYDKRIISTYFGKNWS